MQESEKSVITKPHIKIVPFTDGDIIKLIDYKTQKTFYSNKEKEERVLNIIVSRLEAVYKNNPENTQNKEFNSLIAAPIFKSILLRNNKESLMKVMDLLIRIPDVENPPKNQSKNNPITISSLRNTWGQNFSNRVNDVLEDEKTELLNILRGFVINSNQQESHTEAEYEKYFDSIIQAKKIIDYTPTSNNTSIMDIFNQKDLAEIFPELSEKQKLVDMPVEERKVHRKMKLNELKSKIDANGFFDVMLNQKIFSQVLVNTLAKNPLNGVGNHRTGNAIDKANHFLKHINCLVSGGETDESIKEYVENKFVYADHEEIVKGSYIERSIFYGKKMLQSLTEKVNTSFSYGMRNLNKFLILILLIVGGFFWMHIFNEFFKSLAKHANIRQ
ncbi:hypothetical protein NEPAR06_0829 [Nematocida parisii]|uniref:Uncharacterized protein n=1 Tax=Nematocida parisii (strain ERTm3) TaxID=935791 RepID=I3EEJ1_NEMP3|nr:uncharacterized protein NEPG_02265 [Nematocida parisii ERTm1]EIJ87638.1 hypothetical protein NEQG_02185 [Nematocida parisii ERTm3]KAI5128991.1 hypothetical protein NEPAR08_1425 [Nematocida parisii]EIJ92866.1 hypothetical protein NEPG_02265 [Nematocida parisii ERTm1]KAI5129180.1 hypothetical protein NEPAR03_1580 [Nematocida parisii]KAI5142074.1 hypothetical protein NEPAR04_1430 [Nematocida parisii]|eukprot:XP_013060092.1 hypothetical protein NEPG_02265 [Nematocida parisii ERTm1]